MAAKNNRYGSVLYIPGRPFVTRKGVQSVDPVGDFIACVVDEKWPFVRLKPMALSLEDLRGHGLGRTIQQVADLYRGGYEVVVGHSFGLFVAVAAAIATEKREHLPMTIIGLAGVVGGTVDKSGLSGSLEGRRSLRLRSDLGIDGSEPDPRLVGRLVLIHATDDAGFDTIRNIPDSVARKVVLPTGGHHLSSCEARASIVYELSDALRIKED